MINIVTAPAILTDAIFTAYGGQTGTSTAAQRTAAYAIAESQAVEQIGTFVSPTVVTGTYSWPPLGQPLQLPYTHLNSVTSVTAVHDAGCDCLDDAIELSGCAWVLDFDGATLDLRECGDTLRASCSGCNCGSAYGAGPLQARIVYTAGLPSGAANDPRLLMGLVTIADMALQQIIDPGNAPGGAGNPGIKSFSSLSYSETRSDGSQKMTIFGDSARANYAAQMLSNFKYTRAMKLGW